MFVIVSYDIVNDKARNRASKILLAYGTRVQYSVFECNITSSQLKKLIVRLSNEIDMAEDSIRVYRLCRRCQCVIDIQGIGKHITNELFYLV